MVAVKEQLGMMKKARVKQLTAGVPFWDNIDRQRMRSFIKGGMEQAVVVIYPSFASTDSRRPDSGK